MIVYADSRRTISPPAEIARLSEMCSTPLSREEATGLCLAIGELTQAFLDARFEARGFDDWEEPEQLCSMLSLLSARVLVSGPTPQNLGEIRKLLERLTPSVAQASASARTPEGFAYYALYPELYFEAGRKWQALHPGDSVHVIGIRSIGTLLSAMVAFGAGSPELPVTLRPVGHPFRRELRIGPALRELLLRDPNASFAIVDEGPGLSGSSFGSIADWLEDEGISHERIAFFPSHPGELGPHASDRHRARWARTLRIHEPFRPSLAEIPENALELSAGRWRALVWNSTKDWPPAHIQIERRKFLFRTRGSRILAKFVGLGEYGKRKFELARRISEAGFSPSVIGWNRGFLLQEWQERATPLRGGARQAELAPHLGDYLACLASLPPPDRTGLEPNRLFEMALANCRECGLELLDRENIESAYASALESWNPIHSDNRLHAWEWIRTEQGKLLKTDVADHWLAHDCVGAQDVGWEIAGAAAELGFSDDECRELEERLTGSPKRRKQLRRVRDFYLFSYLSFQLGWNQTASSQIARLDPEEALRLSAAADGYRRQLTERFTVKCSPGSDFALP